ncbi:MAG TPA: orotidine-5'-phosphate decarboxylase [Acidimicrobiia bacterium]
MPEAAPPEVRDRLTLPLDVGDLDAALTMAGRVAPWFGIAKVGHELFAEAGPAAIEPLQALGFRVFADLKYYDIPTTVERAARAIGRRGVQFLNFPAVGGEAMLRAGIAGLREGAREAGHAPPMALAVTVLTSETRADAFDERLETAARAGCDGVVCSAHEIAAVRARDAGLTTMVPGIRLAGGDHQDQARVATPEEATRAGADWLVVGRPVTAAPDPQAAAATVARSVAAGLASLA